MSENIKISEKEIDEKVRFLFSAKCNHTQHMYIDITGDLVQGTLLARIMYWFSVDKNKKSKVRIFKDDYFWIAKQRKDWWEEIRITERQYDKAIKELEKKGFVVLAKYKFNSMPTIHIRPDYENINSATKEWEDRLRKEIIAEYQSDLQNEADGNNTKCNSQGIDAKCKTGITQESNLLTLITNTDYPNRDYHTENTDKYALEDVKRPSSKGDMYASVPEEHKGAPPKKQSRYIPPDYSEEQLIEHIRPTIEENLKTVQEDCGMEYNPKCTDDIVEIVTDFFKQYREKTGHRHKILPDATLINIMYKYFNPPECLCNSNEPSTYSDMAEEYFNTNFNARGGYDGEINLSISHFMSDKIRENCYQRIK